MSALGAAGGRITGSSTVTFALGLAVRPVASVTLTLTMCPPLATVRVSHVVEEPGPLAIVASSTAKVYVAGLAPSGSLHAAFRWPSPHRLR